MLSEEFKEADLIDRVSISLSKEKEEELNHWINIKKEAISIDRNPWIERQKKYLFNYDDFVTFTRKGPWDGSSNYHMPLTVISVDAYSSRLYNIFTQEDAVAISPREAMDEDSVEICKTLRRWYLWDYINGYKGIKGVTHELCKDIVTVGFGVILKGWEIKQRKALMIEKRDQDEFQREMADLAPQAEEAIKEGKQISVKPYREVQKIITVFEGTKLQTVPFENIWFPNSIPESTDLDYPELVLVSTEMSNTEIGLKGKQGLWSSDKVDQVLLETSRSLSTDAKDVKELKDRMTGYNTQNTMHPLGVHDIEYAFCTYDIDDDGIGEELVVTRSDRGTILSIIPLDRVSRTGSRPLFKFDCYQKSRQAYSRGVVEFCYPLQEEMDMHHNMRMDYMQLQTMPWGEYRSGSSLDNQPIRIAPGKFIAVDEIGDLNPKTFNSNAHLLGSEEDRLWKYAEMLTNVSPLSSGIVPQQVGPTRSTSGVITLLQQMEKKFRPIVDQIAIQWRKMEYSILEDLDYRVDPAVKIRVLGPALKDVADIPEVAQEFGNNYLLTKLLDLKMDVASLINSDEVRRNEATLILMQLLNPSLLQQSGIVSMKGLYKAIEDYLKAYGKDPSQYLDEPAFTTQPLSLWQEIQVCAQGQIPPMSMIDNHEEKVEGLLAFIQSQEYQEAINKGIYSPTIQQWVGRTIQKHQGLVQALAARGQPNPIGEQGQDYNALMSGQAPQQGESQNAVQQSGKAPEGRPAPDSVSSARVGGASGDRAGNSK